MKLLTGLFLTFLVAATVSSDNSKTLLIGNSGEPATLDPHKYNLRLEETLLNDLFLGLTTFNADGEIVAALRNHGRQAPVSYTHLTLPTTPYV